MRIEKFDAYCRGCGAIISRRQASRSGACRDCQRIKRNRDNRVATINRQMKAAIEHHTKILVIKRQKSKRE